MATVKKKAQVCSLLAYVCSTAKSGLFKLSVSLIWTCKWHGWGSSKLGEGFSPETLYSFPHRSAVLNLFLME